MGRYVAKRMAQAWFVVFGVVCATFVILRLVPGDPARVLLPQGAPREAIEQLRRQLGVDQPLLTQFGRFLGDLATGSLGDSFRYDRPVLKLVLDAFPRTLGLAACALVTASLIAIPLGTFAAARSGGILDRSILIFALVAQSVPPFWLGLMLVYNLAVQRPWFPAIGLEGASSFVLPTATLATGLVAPLIRTARQGMVEVLAEDYIRTARAKGLPEWKVVVTHALRNAALPVITVLGLQVGFLLGGAVVIEVIFNWPGVGLLALQSIQTRDFPVVQGIVVLIAVVYVTINLLIDLGYAYIDPRVRLGYMT